MEELAQPVGNAKICGEFDMDAATAGDQNTNGGGLFQRLGPSWQTKRLCRHLLKGSHSFSLP